MLIFILSVWVSDDSIRGGFKHCARANKLINHHRVFPDIDISDQFDAALLERDEEIARTEEEARLAEIEARLLATERRARYRYRYSFPYFPGFSHGHAPVVEDAVPHKVPPPDCVPTFISAELKR